jgi:hypothetical protein
MKKEATSNKSMKNRMIASVLLAALVVFNGSSHASAEATGLVPAFDQPISKSPGEFTIQITNYDQNYEWRIATDLGQATMNSFGLITVIGLNYGEKALLTVSTIRVGTTTNTRTVSGSSNLLFAGKMPALAQTLSTVDGFTAHIVNFDPSYTWQISTNHGDAKIGDRGFVSVSGLTAGSPATVSVTASRIGYVSQTAVLTSTALGYSSDQESGTGATNSGILVPIFGDPTSLENGFTVPLLNYDSSYTYVFSSTNGVVQLQNGGTLLISNLKPSQTSIVTVITTKNGVKPGSSNVAGAALAGDTQPLAPSPQIYLPLVPRLTLASKSAHGFEVNVTNFDDSFAWSCIVNAPAQCQLAYGGVVKVINASQNGKYVLTVSTNKKLIGSASTVFIQDSTDDPNISYQPKAGIIRKNSQGFTFQITNFDSRIKYLVRTNRGSVKIDSTGMVSAIGLLPNMSASIRLYSTINGSVKGSLTISGNSLNSEKK